MPEDIEQEGAADVAPVRAKWLGPPGVWYGMPLARDHIYDVPERLRRKARQSDLWRVVRGKARDRDPS